VSEVQAEGNITVYSNVCLRYRVWEILLCTVMCVRGTEGGKCYCVQLCLPELQSDVLLLYTLMCV